MTATGVQFPPLPRENTCEQWYTTCRPYIFATLFAGVYLASVSRRVLCCNVVVYIRFCNIFEGANFEGTDDLETISVHALIHQYYVPGAADAADRD